MAPSTAPNLPIILYHYPYSPYARRIVWYLRLRGIPYMQCLQPPVLPRPDLSLKTHLSLAHRRIPVLAVGRDVYLDTRLMLRKLEALPLSLTTLAILPSTPPIPSATSTSTSSPNSSSFSGASDTAGGVDINPPLAAPPGTEALALERLLAELTTGTDLFFRAGELLSAKELPLLRGAGWKADREDFYFGGKGGTQGEGQKEGGGEQGRGQHGEGEGEGGKEEGEGGEGPRKKEMEMEMEEAARRADALAEIRRAMAMLERSVLADGREWILGGNDGPRLADIEAAWIFHWVTGLPGALDKDVVDKDKFPRVYSWVERFQKAVGAAKARVEVKTVTGEEAAGIIKGEGVDFYEPEAEVDSSEPIVRACGLRKGQRIEVWPTDSGAAHRDRGKLVGLGADEVVWETDAGVRVHAPRHGFRVRPAAASGSARGASL